MDGLDGTTDIQKGMQYLVTTIAREHYDGKMLHAPEEYRQTPMDLFAGISSDHNSEKMIRICQTHREENQAYGIILLAQVHTIITDKQGC